MAPPRKIREVGRPTTDKMREMGVPTTPPKYGWAAPQAVEYGGAKHSSVGMVQMFLSIQH